MATLTKARKAKGSAKHTPPREVRPPVFGRGYLILELRIPDIDPDGPFGPLYVPPNWARHSSGEFRLSEMDFLTRDEALKFASLANRKSLESGDIREWSLVFRLGHVDGGFALVEGGCCTDMHLDTSVELVRPTPEECEQYE